MRAKGTSWSRNEQIAVVRPRPRNRVRRVCCMHMHLQSLLACRQRDEVSARVAVLWQRGRSKCPPSPVQQAGPPFRLFARMSSFPAAHTAGDYRHCRVNLSSGLAKSTLSRSLCYNTTDRNDHTPRAPSSPPTYSHCPQQERRGLSAKNHVNLRIISIADTQQSASALLLRGRKVRSTRISSCPHECGGHKHATTAHECLTRTQEVHAMLVDRQ